MQMMSRQGWFFPTKNISELGNPENEMAKTCKD